jgi:hypothetical protein
MPDAEIKHLMKSLGDSINETLAESQRINEAIQSIRDSGYEVNLTIEAKIGVNRKGKEDLETITSPAQSEEPVRLRITSDDAKFLKSLKIAYDSERTSDPL